MRSMAASSASARTSLPTNRSPSPVAWFGRRAIRSSRPISPAASGTTRKDCGCRASSSVMVQRSNISLMREANRQAREPSVILLRQALRVGAAIMASAVSGCVALSVVFGPTPVTLATGTPGGIYHPVGNAICRMFNLPEENQAVPCIAVSSEGAVANIQRIENGTSTFGLSQTDVAYAAYHGAGPFAAAGPDPKLRVLIALYPEAFTVVAREDAH